MKPEEERGEKRKAEPASADEAMKAMRVDDMITFINEIEADLKSLHEDDFVADSSLDPVKDPDKVFAGRKGKIQGPSAAQISRTFVPLFF